MKSKYSPYILSFLFLVTIFFGSCKEGEYQIPTLSTALQNDCIKRSEGPNIVGSQIEFAYAMALGATKGKLVSAQVEASIAGASATYLENKSYHTDPNSNGDDVGITIGLPSVNEGSKTTVVFNVDTNAATLRYYYVIPPDAYGKSVSFTFTAKSSNGESVSYKMGPYTISTMDMVRNLSLTDNANCYLSIADMAVYTAAAATLNADKIDLVYIYRTTPATFSHALVAPATDTQYLPDVTLPAGVNNNTKIQKAYNLQDRDLFPESPFGRYVDDLDLQKLNLSTAANFALNLKAEGGVWVETANGKFRAYILINSINNGAKQVTLSMKRYQVY